MIFFVSVIELACGEYGDDKIDGMVKATDNGKSLDWFNNPDRLRKELDDSQMLMSKENNTGMQATSSLNQLKILLKRGFLKARRDAVSIIYHENKTIYKQLRFCCFRH